MDWPNATVDEPAIIPKKRRKLQLGEPGDEVCLILEDSLTWGPKLFDQFQRVLGHKHVNITDNLDQFLDLVDKLKDRRLILSIDLQVMAYARTAFKHDADTALDLIEEYFVSYLSEYTQQHHVSPLILVISGYITLERRHRLLRLGIKSENLFLRSTFASQIADEDLARRVSEFRLRSRNRALMTASYENLVDVELHIEALPFPLPDIPTPFDIRDGIGHATIVIRSTPLLEEFSSLVGKPLDLRLYGTGLIVEHISRRGYLEIEMPFELDRPERGNDLLSHISLNIAEPNVCDGVTFSLKPLDDSYKMKIYPIAFSLTYNGKLIHRYEVIVRFV